MYRVDVRHDLARLELNLGLYADERLRAAVRAANRTMTTARADAARRLKEDYAGLKISQLKARLKLQRATASRPVAAITFSGRRFALYGNFGMRAAGQWGVGFRGLPWRLETVSGEEVTPEMLRRAFRQRSRRSGRADVFSRLGPKRASFELVLAPGLARAFSERKVGEATVRAIETRFPVVFRQEARFRISRRGF
jgi:hypothetical protein